MGGNEAAGGREELVQVALLQASAGGSVPPVCAPAAADHAISNVAKQSVLPDHQLLWCIAPALYPDAEEELAAMAERLLVGQNLVAVSADEVLVRGDERQVVSLCACGEEPVGGIAVRQNHLICGKHDFMGDRRLLEREL